MSGVLEAVLLVLCAQHTLSGLLDLDEIDNVQYSVSILDTPVSYEDRGELRTGNVIVMVNKFGQKYHCELPTQETTDSTSKTGEGADTNVDVKSLLQPLYTSAACLTRTKDWWTYQVCFGAKITQFHMENEKPVGAIINLGTYNTDRDENDEKLPYYSDWYTNGTKCDLTAVGRETELRFVCHEKATKEFIGDILETRSCEYTIVVHTDKICSVPRLRPAAEAVPLGISCKPILAEEQMRKYEEYSRLNARKAELQLKKLKEQQQKFLSLLSGKPGSAPSKGLLGTGAMNNLMKELGSFMDSALSGVTGASTMKIVDLRGMMNEEDRAGLYRGYQTLGLDGAGQNPDLPLEETDETVAAKAEQWNLVSPGKKPSKKHPDQVLAPLKARMDEIFLKIHEHKKLLEKFTDQLKDTEIFLKKNTEKEQKYDAGIIEKLEVQRNQLEETVQKTRATIDGLITEGMDVKMKFKLKKLEVQKTKLKIMSLLKELEVLKEAGLEAPEEFHGVLAKIMEHYYQVTGTFINFSLWFDLAADYVDGAEFHIQELRNYYKFSDGEVDTLRRALGFGEKTTGSFDKQSISKHENIIKENMKAEFPNILKEAMDELGLQEEDVEDLDGKMGMMENELNVLLKKLKGAEQDVDSSFRSLKRDGKKSVKKELREEGEEDVVDDKEDEKKEKKKSGDETQKLIKEAKKKLEEIETELGQVEKGIREKKKKLKTDSDKVEFEFQKMTEQGLEELDPAGGKDLAKHIESSIKIKLQKLGLDTGDRPIEVKVITTNVPLEGEEGHFEGMIHNLIYGNQQGYLDIDNQRKAEANYKFNWDDSLMEKMNTELDRLENDVDSGLGDQGLEAQQDLYDIVENTEDEYAESDPVSLIDEMFGLREHRRRPSSGDNAFVDDLFGGSVGIDLFGHHGGGLFADEDGNNEAEPDVLRSSIRVENNDNSDDIEESMDQSDKSGEPKVQSDQSDPPSDQSDTSNVPSDQLDKSDAPSDQSNNSDQDVEESPVSQSKDEL